MDRDITAQEREELAKRMAMLAQGDGLLPVLTAACFSAGLAFVLGSIITALARWAIGLRLESLPTWFAMAAGLGVLAAGVNDTLRRNRKRRTQASGLAQDLNHGRVTEITVEVTGLHRFQEPEHFTEFLVFTCADGRLRAVLDDSTFGDAPRQSTLQLGRRMTALRFPLSGTEQTHFSGDTLRRPKAIQSDPRTWPAEGWITPDDLARIDGAPA